MLLKEGFVVAVGKRTCQRWYVVVSPIMTMVQCVVYVQVLLMRWLIPGFFVFRVKSEWHNTVVELSTEI